MSSSTSQTAYKPCGPARTAAAASPLYSLVKQHLFVNMRFSAVFKVALAAIQAGVVTASLVPVTRDTAPTQLCLTGNPAVCGADKDCVAVTTSVLPDMGVCAVADTEAALPGNLLGSCTADRDCGSGGMCLSPTAVLGMVLPLAAGLPLPMLPELLGILTGALAGIDGVCMPDVLSDLPI
ncbi:hypothetical protein C8Q76DRAFT_798981 [Earliella scabrosa]|nr:hypothetical protein C8Q76DRAFT_798981 [Earliella scabrosa]